MVIKNIYDQYLASLINGKKNRCQNAVNQLRNKEISLKSLYEDLFQKSLYDVGELWEFNHISVAVEHMATAITETLMSILYAEIEFPKETGLKVLISSSENEYHQIGVRMISDFFELNGWESFFLGANTPVHELIKMADQIRPHVIGLSLSVYFHLPQLNNMIQTIRNDCPTLPIIIGGQAFKHGNGHNFVQKYRYANYIESLEQLISYIKAFSNDKRAIT